MTGFGDQALLLRRNIWRYFDGMKDEEAHFEPAPGMWRVGRKAELRAPLPGAPTDGEYWVGSQRRYVLHDEQKSRSSGFSVEQLGQILIEQGLITDDQLQSALDEHRRTPKSLGRTLIDLGMIKESDLVRALAEQVGHDVPPRLAGSPGKHDPLRHPFLH